MEKPSSTITYQTVDSVSGPLLFVKKTRNISYGEIVTIEDPSGNNRTGQVLEVASDMAVVQVFEGTQGLDTNKTTVRFLGDTIKLACSQDMIGRVFSGSGKTIDGGPAIFAEENVDIVGAPINPYSREFPKEFIQTGISSIDGLNTLVRGQKLPIFSGSGLPHNQIAAQIARQAQVLGSDDDFAVIFGAIGITAEEARFFKEDFERTGVLEKVVLFLNTADQPAVERLVTPRMALTAAEYLAYEYDYHLLVILTDLTNYAESLREISAARQEVPGRRGYPGYLYTDLSTIYERAGRIKGRNGTITQIPILTMPSDDLTHPIPDLTGYITEGQLIVERSLDRKNVYPPIQPLRSLSRLMREGIGTGQTHPSHNSLSAQLFAAYAKGQELRALAAVVGEEALSTEDNQVLEFTYEFETRFLTQGQYENRSILETLELGWDLLTIFDEDACVRISPKEIKAFHPNYRTKPLSLDDPEP